MNTRLIARLDIKGENLIKGVHLEGLRVIGDPQEHAQKYYLQGADELLYIDIVASLYGRSKLTEIVRRSSKNVFIPITVGGGIRSIKDVDDLLRAGADKVAINTAAIKRPSLITEVAERFGSQCMVLYIEAKSKGDGSWVAYTDCARENSGVDVEDWVKEAVELGAGEILVTSIDNEGTKKGYDIELIKTVSSSVSVPIIASGGYGSPQHMLDALLSGADALAFADALHFNRSTIEQLRLDAKKLNISVRKC